MADFKVPSLPTTSTSKTPSNCSLNSDNSEETNDEHQTTAIENEINVQEIEIQNYSTIEIPYHEPKWSVMPPIEHVYKFEVLKSGRIVEEYSNLQSRPFWLFGRFPGNQIMMAHPTISRYHCVLQYRQKDVPPSNEKEETNANDKIEEGWYIYDLGSTHGTFLNKQRCPTRVYVRIRVGHMLKLGASTRNFILQGPEFDEEAESELTVTEIKELRKQLEIETKKREEMQEKMREKEGISWGMMEDADEETDLSVNPYATTNNEELFLDDPKKTLRGFFEREGLDLEYKCDEMSPGTFVCRVELPLDDSNGKPIIAEVCHKGKKKECVVQCALESCRILDRHGVLRQSHHEPLKRKIKPDSDDEDDFLDRTGDIERKKLRKAASLHNAALTYDDLLKQEQNIEQNLKAIEENIQKYQELSKRLKENKGKQDEDLDNFMESLTEDSTSYDKTEIRKLRVEQQRLKSEYQKNQRLLKIAKPLDLSKITPSTSDKAFETKKCLSLPLFGKRNKFKFTPIVRKESKSIKEADFINEEVEEDEEDKQKQKVDKAEECVERNNIVSKNSVAKEADSKVEKDIKINNIVEKESEVSSPIAISEDSVKEPKKSEVQGLNLIYENKNGENIETMQIDEKVDHDGEIETITEWVSSQSGQNEINADFLVEERENESVQEDTENEDIKRKKRIRIRNRNRRENVDIDDFAELEDSEKHSEWLPPNNQTGDGLTKLNERYGY